MQALNPSQLELRLRDLFWATLTVLQVNLKVQNLLTNQLNERRFCGMRKMRQIKASLLLSSLILTFCVNPTHATEPSTMDQGTVKIEEWFGKGWIGNEATCKSILKIANTATRDILQAWKDYEGMRVIALNPVTGTLLTFTISPESGDPLPPLITGNVKSTKGKWNGFENFFDMFEASRDYWASYNLSYKNSKFKCEARSVPSKNPTISPTPTKSQDAGKQSEDSFKDLLIPARVELNVSTTRSDNHGDAEVKVVHFGDLRKLNSRPVGYRFFMKNRPIKVVKFDFANCKSANSKGTRWSCAIANFNPYDFPFTEYGAQISAAAYNPGGQGPMSKDVLLYDKMLDLVVDDFRLIDWSSVSEKIFGTGIKNWFGFRSRDASSVVVTSYIMKGEIPKAAAFEFTLEESRYENGRKVLLNSYILKPLPTEQKGTVYRISGSTDQPIKIRGDSLYVGSLKIYDGQGAYRGYALSFYSIDYKMKLACSSKLFVATGVLDTSKILLGLADNIESWVLLFVKENLDQLGISKLSKKDKLDVTNKIFARFGLAGRGLDLIEIIEAKRNGDNVAVQVIVKERIEKEVYGLVSKKLPNSTYLVTLSMTVEDAWNLLKDLSAITQKEGKENGQLISEVCSAANP